MLFEHDELDGKYSLIGCRTTCVLLCMLLSCLAQTLECCLHCMSLPVIGQGMPLFKWLAVNRWTLSATFRGGKQVCFFLLLKQVVKVGNLFIWMIGIWCFETLLELSGPGLLGAEFTATFNVGCYNYVQFLVRVLPHPSFRACSQLMPMGKNLTLKKQPHWG